LHPVASDVYASVLIQLYTPKTAIRSVDYIVQFFHVDNYK
jgi:hypothetical protein